MVGMESLLYFGGWQLGEMANSHPRTNSEDSGLTVKVFKGKIVWGDSAEVSRQPQVKSFPF